MAVEDQSCVEHGARSADEQAVELVRSKLTDADNKEVDKATVSRFLRATGGKIDLVSRAAFCARLLHGTAPAGGAGGEQPCTTCPAC